MSEPPRKTRKRFETAGHARFLTFSTFHRAPIFEHRRWRDAFAAQLAATRERMNFMLIGWVLMPDHAHLLIAPRLPESPVDQILHALKAPIAKRLMGELRRSNSALLESLQDSNGATSIWQRGGGFDRNIYSDEELEEKLLYMHNNPVKRALCARPEEWEWSSAPWYSTRGKGLVPIDAIAAGL